jgi:hypothetical protein
MLAGRVKPRRHVSFQLSEDQESAASLSDGDCSEMPLLEDEAGEEAAGQRVEIEERLAIDHNERKHMTWRRRWCPLCSVSPSWGDLESQSFRLITFNTFNPLALATKGLAPAWHDGRFDAGWAALVKTTQIRPSALSLSGPSRTAIILPHLPRILRPSRTQPSPIAPDAGLISTTAL